MDSLHSNSGKVGDCSEQQLKALEQLREFVAEKGLSASEYDDHYLLRFLRSRNFDLEKTQAKFNAFLKWRTEKHVQDIMTFKFKDFDLVREYYTHGFHKTDKKGRPVYIEQTGQVKVTQLLQITTEEELEKHFIQSFELLLQRIFPACSAAVGRNIDSLVMIFDLKGFSMKLSQKNVFSIVERLIKLMQDNYPEILGQMFIVNAPMQFQSMWSAIKVWIDDKTREKITVVGSGFLNPLLEIIDIANIPDFLGGKSKDPIVANIGPWNPKGNTPLYPCEESQEGGQNKAQDNENKDDNDDDEDDQEAVDFAALRSALMGNISGPFSQAPHVSGKYELTTQGAKFQVSDTPLNTQAEEDY